MIAIALGANQYADINGERLSPKNSFRRALQQLTNDHNIEIQAVSGLWESPAWPDPFAQPAYKNAVAHIHTQHSASDLLVILKQIEKGFGRVDSVRNAPRPLDLDILDYKGQIVETKHLTLPHPRMCERAFVLFPLQEIVSDWHDPIKNRAISEWVARLKLSEVSPLKRLGAFI